MPAERYLIVNADDFGQSPGVNRGIVEACERGIVTSASLMVRWPAAAEAAAYCKGRPHLSLGLHIDLGEWVYRDGEWTSAYEVIPTDDAVQVEAEVARQLDRFCCLVGAQPTHLDSHQHVHLHEPARSTLAHVARELGVPLRHYNPRVQFCGLFYGQTGKGAPLPDAISVTALVGILASLPPGITELVCHPGAGSDLAMPYGREREEELKVLCDPRVRATVEAQGIRLCSFTNACACD